MVPILPALNNCSPLLPSSFFPTPPNSASNYRELKPGCCSANTQVGQHAVDGRLRQSAASLEPILPYPIVFLD